MIGILMNLQTPIFVFFFLYVLFSNDILLDFYFTSLQLMLSAVWRSLNVTIVQIIPFFYYFLLDH